MPHELHPLLDSGILLTTVTAVLLNLFFNGARGSVAEAREAALQAEGGH
jgi:NCS2 family nucleobase:cation symporter-2